MSEDDDTVDSAALADVPDGLKKMLRWLYLLYSDRPDWQRPLIGGVFFVVSLLLGNVVTDLFSSVLSSIASRIGRVSGSFSADQISIVLLGLVLGQQRRIARKIKTVERELTAVTDSVLETDGGRMQSEEAGSTGGGAIAGVIAGAALGSSFGPGGTFGGAVFGAILGDELERYSERTQPE